MKRDYKKAGKNLKQAIKKLRSHTFDHDKRRWMAVPTVADKYAIMDGCLRNGMPDYRKHTIQACIRYYAVATMHDGGIGNYQDVHTYFDLDESENKMIAKIKRLSPTI